MPGNIQSIERAAAILRLLSGRTRRLGVVDLAGELGLPKGTVHGLLRTLQHVGFVEQDPETGKYQLGAALLHMGSSYLDGNELRTRALNWSDSLAARTQEAVRIGTLHEGQVLIVHHVFRPDDSLQTLDVGSLLPAHATALGKMLLAHHPYALAELAGNGFASSPTRRSATRSGWSASWRASASAAGRPTSASSTRGRCRWRPRSWIAAASPWARWVSSVHRSGCWWPGSRAGSCWPTCVRRPAPCRASSARSRGEREVALRERYVAAIDQGTASSRCLVFDRSGRIVSVAQKEHHHIYPAPRLGRARPRGDLAQRRVRRRPRARRGAAGASDLVALGIANQRETTLVWDRATGQAVHNAINWQDTRTDHIVRDAVGRARRRLVPRALRAAARHLLLRPQAALAARHRARPARARRRGRGAVRDDGLLADLAADRTPPHRRHQRQPDDADGPAHARLGRRAARRARRPAPDAARDPAVGRDLRRRRRPARRRAGGRRARRPAGGAVRPDVLCPRRGQVHLRDRQLPPAQHRRAPGRLRQRAADHAVLPRRRRGADLCAGGIDRGDRRARAVVSRQPRR